MIDSRICTVLLVAALAMAPGLRAAAMPAPVVSDRAAGIEEMGYLPVPGSVPAANPPAFAWLNEKGADKWQLQVAADAQFTSVTDQVENWPYLLYTPTEPLGPGRYYWRYRYTAKGQGEPSNWSTTRSFDVASTATVFPRPSAEELKRRVPMAHPRMFTTPDTIEALRSTTTTNTTQLKALLSAADKYLSAPLMAEPKPWSAGEWNAGEWGEYLRQASATTAQMDTLAFAYLLTGESQYGERAREALLNYAKWDPAGPSSMKINDEVGMPVLHSMSRTYDWVYPLLSESDKAAVRNSIAARGHEAYQRLRRKPYEQFAFDSHAGRMWHFLGEAGLAFYGEIPEAETWLNYATTIFYGWYPAWGKQDGGWAEGMWYWSSYNSRVTWWLDLMRLSLGIDGTRKPFYAHVGDFPLYVCPPGNPVGGFGDFSEKPPPGNAVGQPMAAYALYKQNPYWEWYAQQTNPNLQGDPFDYLRSLLPRPAAKAPAGQPTLKIFPEVGTAAFNTDLTSAAHNMHLAMRCSPYGNVSHSHNDQNAIVLAAYGEPLLVNTGLRDFYGSPFCKEYYWQTIAHNSVLFDGKGQIRAPQTTGTFLAHGQESDGFAWIVGDATRAYPGLTDLYRRWVVFVPDSGVLLIDEVQTTASKISVLFHGRAPFTLDERSRSFSLQNGKVTLNAEMSAWPSMDEFSINQTDHYPVPLGNNKKPIFEEWHLNVDVPLEQHYQHPQYVTTWLGIHQGDKAKRAVTTSGSWTENTFKWERKESGAAPLRLTVDFKNLIVTREK